jgi:holliday junction DNA helicase RuvA
VIGWLRGRVVWADLEGTVVVDVQGVGYEVQAATGEYRAGDDVEMFVATQVRADAIVLFGFASLADRDFFSLLLATPGVGPSTALAALRTMPVEEMRRAIDEGDVKRVAQVPGIGAKTASRIVLELKGKLVETNSVSTVPSRANDLEEALRSLGYGLAEVRDALEGVELPDDESAALRIALQRLGRR